jgi:hypothetical protein
MDDIKARKFFIKKVFQADPLRATCFTLDLPVPKEINQDFIDKVNARMKAMGMDCHTTVESFTNVVKMRGKRKIT